MSVAEACRRQWRLFRAPVLEGRAGCLRVAVYRLLAPVMSRLKTQGQVQELSDRALYFLYHPEQGWSPRDAWQAPDPNLSAADRQELRRRYSADRKVAQDILGVCPLEDGDASCSARIGTIGVHVHVFYPELLPRILSALSQIPEDFDLFVSIPDGVTLGSTDLEQLNGQLPHLRKLVCRHCPNRGRDIAPFLCLFGDELASHDILLHLHTKKSPAVNDCEDWLGQILRFLLGSETRCASILQALSQDTGMVSPPDYVAMPEDPVGWGANKAICEDMAERGGVPRGFLDCLPVIDFPQGSMFWATSAFLRRLFQLGLTFDEFPAEPIGTDATLAHALERLFFVWGAYDKAGDVRKGDRSTITPKGAKI